MARARFAAMVLLPSFSETDVTMMTFAPLRFMWYSTRARSFLIVSTYRKPVEGDVISRPRRFL